MERIELMGKRGERIKVTRDDYPENPYDCNGSEWNLASNHKDYSSMTDNKRNPSGVLEKYFSHARGVGEIREWDTKDALYIPVFMYIHSGVAISLDSFRDPWDSGIGYVAYIDKAEYRKTHGKWSKRDALVSLQGLVTELNEYLAGEVYLIEVADKDGEDVTDACGGFYGMDEVRAYLEDMDYIEVGAEIAA